MNLKGLRIEETFVQFTKIGQWLEIPYANIVMEKDIASSIHNSLAKHLSIFDHFLVVASLLLVQVKKLLVC